MAKIPSHVGDFLEALRTKYDLPGEDEAAVSDALKEAKFFSGWPEASATINVASEADASGVSTKPDLAVFHDGTLVGYVELKAPGKGADPDSFGGHDAEQWKQHSRLPNLIYTDGVEWALYRNGERVSSVSLPDVTAGASTAIDESTAREVESLVRNFFSWEPIVPNNPEELAEVLAPLTRMLRDEVRQALENPDSKIYDLAELWRLTLFADADDEQFADAYAQTLTYAYLLIQLDPETHPLDVVPTPTAANELRDGHALLGQALGRLADKSVKEGELSTSIAVLERTIAAVDPERIADGDESPWLYFYEHFLAEYDNDLRKNRGVYYTPVQVVRCQVRLVDELLKDRLGRSRGFAGDDVVTLDPAVGTGTYLLGIIDHTLQQTRDFYGEGAVSGDASKLAENLHGFEYLVGPYSVASLRLSQRLREAGANFPDDRDVQIYLTDTLASPYTEPAEHLQVLAGEFAEEQARAREVKSEKPVMVCLGNPPYDRHDANSDVGGWVRGGPEQEQPILDDFIEPVREAGAGVHLKNLYNLYIYFWRWALWKVFESQDGPGIVSFITGSSYLQGEAFLGVRQVMRETFDEMWIIDLGGEGRGTRKTDNVFDIKAPVAIAIGLRESDESDPDTLAPVHYTRITGTESEKLTTLDSVSSLTDFEWRDCPNETQAAFLPRAEGKYQRAPKLTDLFPWQHSGAQLKRTWPISPSREVLERRWRRLLQTSPEKRGELLSETRDRKADKKCLALFDREYLDPIADLSTDANCPEVVRYAYRSFDRQYLIADPRLGDYLRPVLWHTYSDSQLFLTSLLTSRIGTGPALTASAYVPDLHHFRGSYGARDVIPLWRNADAKDPNVTNGLLEHLSDQLGREVAAPDLFAYVYAVMGCVEYSRHFADELRQPPPSVPLTMDREVFDRAVAEGRRLIWLHTYGERFMPEDGRSSIPQGEARNTTAVPLERGQYPRDFSYDPSDRTVYVGDAEFAPVSRAVWEFDVSGYKVVQRWLGNRMYEPEGKKSSPLDEIFLEAWPHDFTREFLELLWVVEHTIEAQETLESIFRDVLASELISASELPSPSEEERDAPSYSRGSTNREAQETLFD